MNCKNYEKVLKYLRSSDMFHNRIKDISANTELSYPTLQKILARLVDERKIIEVKSGTAKHYQAIGDDDK